MQIVLARAEVSAEFVEDGRRDIGERDVWRPCVKAVSLMWSAKERPGDLEKAHAFAAREGYIVLTYAKEREPLVKARAEILKLHAAGKTALYE